MRLLQILSRSSSPSENSKQRDWLEGYEAGWTQAWALMTPLWADGMKQARTVIYDAAVQATLDGLEKVIDARLKERLNGHYVH